MPVRGLGVVLSKGVAEGLCLLADAGEVSQKGGAGEWRCDLLGLKGDFRGVRFFSQAARPAGSEKIRVCPATFTFCCTWAFKRKTR